MGVKNAWHAAHTAPCWLKPAALRSLNMTKRICAVSIACGFGVSLLLTAAHYSAARAQSADLVLCDRIAADPGYHPGHHPENRFSLQPEIDGYH